MNRQLCLVLVLSFCCIVAARVDLDDDWQIVSDELLLDEQNIEKASSVADAFQSEEKERLMALVHGNKSLSPEDTLVLVNLFQKYYERKAGPVREDEEAKISNEQLKVIELKKLANNYEDPTSNCANSEFSIAKSAMAQIPTSTRAVLPLRQVSYEKQVKSCKIYAISDMANLLGKLTPSQRQVLIDFGNNFNIDGSAHKGGLTDPRSVNEYAAAAVAYLKQHDHLDPENRLDQEELTSLIKTELIDVCQIGYLKEMTLKAFTLPDIKDDIQDELEPQVREKFWSWTERAGECIMMLNRVNQVYEAAYKIYHYGA